MTELNKGKAMHVSSEGTFVSSNEEKQLSIGEVIEDMQNRIAALESTVTAQASIISAIQATSNSALAASVVESENSISKVVTEPGIITATVNKK